MIPFEQLLADHEAAGVGYRNAVAKEVQARLDRHALRATLRDSLIGQTNPLTGKPHSATSAQEAAEMTPEYMHAVRDEMEDLLDKMAHEEDVRTTGWIVEHAIAERRNTIDVEVA